MTRVYILEPTQLETPPVDDFGYRLSTELLPTETFKALFNPPNWVVNENLKCSVAINDGEAYEYSLGPNLDGNLDYYLWFFYSYGSEDSEPEGCFKEIDIEVDTEDNKYDIDTARYYGVSFSYTASDGRTPPYKHGQDDITIAIYYDEPDPKPVKEGPFSKNVIFTDHGYSDAEKLMKAKGGTPTGYNYIEKMASVEKEEAEYTPTDTTVYIPIIVDNWNVAEGHIDLKYLPVLLDRNIKNLVLYIDEDNGEGYYYQYFFPVQYRTVCTLEEYCYVDIRSVITRQWDFSIGSVGTGLVVDAIQAYYEVGSDYQNIYVAIGEALSRVSSNDIYKQGYED